MTKTLTFKNADLLRLVLAATAYWPNGTRPAYGQEEPAPAGFWIVGDHGVYLMHNGKGEQPATVVYAVECNPDTLEFEDWWQTKRETWGGDDGVEYLEPALIIDAATTHCDLLVRFSADQFELLTRKTN